MTAPVAKGERKSLDAVLADPGAGGLSPARRRMLQAAALAVAALLAVALVWSLGGNSSSVRYVTEPVTRGKLVVVVTATGSVQPTNKVEVSSELSGTVRKVLVDYNSPVTAGQILAELDTDKLRATVDSSRARLVAAEAKVAEIEATIQEKQRDYVRKKALADKAVTSAHDLDAAKAAYDRAIATRGSANADVGVAVADLSLNETNLSKASIRSPINGIILKRNVDPGQTVASTLQAPVLFTIAEDLTKMELQVDVDEADVGKVKVGQSATFAVDAHPDRKFPATIRDLRFASETIQGVVTYKAVLTVDNGELLLRPGMTATAEIRVMEIPEALLISNAALRYRPPAAVKGDDRSFLRRILPGRPPFRPASAHDETGPDRTLYALRAGRPEPVRVVIGSSDGKRTEIKTGDLKEGTPIILDQAAARK